MVRGNKICISVVKASNSIDNPELEFIPIFCGDMMKNTSQANEKLLNAKNRLG